MKAKIVDLLKNIGIPEENACAIADRVCDPAVILDELNAQMQVYASEDEQEQLEVNNG